MKVSYDMAENVLDQLRTISTTAIADALNAIREKEGRDVTIDKVLLVGGSTRIPAVRKFLSDYFKSTPIDNVPRVDECVARGAALHAAIIQERAGEKLSEYAFYDNVTMSIGTAIISKRTKCNDKMRVAISRNTPKPAFGRLQTWSTDVRETIIDVIYS